MAVINSTKLPELRNLATPAVPDYNKLASSSTFHPTEGTKAVEVNLNDSTKTVRVETELPAK